MKIYNTDFIALKILLQKFCQILKIFYRIKITILTLWNDKKKFQYF